MGAFSDLSDQPPKVQQKFEMRPAKLEKQTRTAKRQEIDDKESAKVKVRSEGRCEIWTEVNRKVAWRCKRRALHVHHMLGGIGVRGRGESAKAIRKQHVCPDCHSDIGAHVLVRQGAEMPHFRDRYRRVK